MKKIIDILKDNFFLSIIFYITKFIICYLSFGGFLFAPIFIGKSIFGFNASLNSGFWFFSCVLWFIFAGVIHSKYGDDTKEYDKIIISYAIIGFFASSATIINSYHEYSSKNSVSSVPKVAYTSSRDYSSRDSNTNSNYRHSEPSNYAQPAKTSDDVNISHVPIPKTEKIAENESVIPSNDNEDTQKIDVQHENEENSSTSAEIGLYDSWEYVTSDEYGNKYYINKKFWRIYYNNEL